jgi:hypothetical protein
LAEYLLALADQKKDDFFYKQYTTIEAEAKAKIELGGELQMIDELLGIPYFIKSFKVAQVVK